MKYLKGPCNLTERFDDLNRKQKNDLKAWYMQEFGETKATFYNRLKACSIVLAEKILIQMGDKDLTLDYIRSQYIEAEKSKEEQAEQEVSTHLVNL